MKSNIPDNGTSITKVNEDKFISYELSNRWFSKKKSPYVYEKVKKLEPASKSE